MHVVKELTELTAQVSGRRNLLEINHDGCETNGLHIISLLRTENFARLVVTIEPVKLHSWFTVQFQLIRPGV